MYSFFSQLMARFFYNVELIIDVLINFDDYAVIQDIIWVSLKLSTKYVYGTQWKVGITCNHGRILYTELMTTVAVYIIIIAKI